MILFYIIMWLLFVHWVSDFVLQSDDMAKNKSTDMGALCCHSFIYFLSLLVLTSFGYLIGIMPFIPSITYFIVNGICHFIIDFWTSRINSYLYEKGERHWFFTMIGFDQLLHYLVLFFTLCYVG